MATKTDFGPLAASVAEALGGPDNVRSITHCATRLRFKIKDPAKADLKKVEAVPGVITALAAGGQHQVVVGNDVPLAYAALMDVPGMRVKGIKDGSDTAEPDDDDGPEEKKNLLNQFIDLISALFSPIIWVLAGIGLGKAGLALATSLNWLDTESSTYAIFHATFDGLFYFLPFFLAVTSAKRFKVNQFIAMAITAALVHPTLTALVGAEGLTFLGIPVNMMSYASSVIPIVVAVWLAGYLQRWLERVLPGAVRNFFTPLVVVLVMVPLVLLTIGPVTMWASAAVSDGIGFLFETVPWLAGAVLGGFWQVFVMFGLHWGFNPLFLNDLANQGYSLMMAPLMAAIFGQVGAAFAVWLRTKNPERRKVAGPGVLSGLLAGVTEPIIYGVNLPLKYPFYAGIIGGAVGGAIIAQGGSGFDTYVFPSLMAFAATLTIGSFTAQLIGSGVALLIGFVLSFVLVGKAEKETDAPQPAPIEVAPETGVEGPGSTTPAAAVATAVSTAVDGEILAPVSGEYVPLAEVPDKVFASGAMGEGFGIRTESAEILAPVSGKLIAVQKTGHAYGIRGDNGVEILVHVGIDTVKMNGAGFETLVARGEHVEVGQLLGRVDLDAVAEAGYDATTIVILTNSKKLGELSTTVDGGRLNSGDVVMRVES